MKHLKIKGVLSPDHKTVTVTLLEQTHFNTNFGDTENKRYAGLGTFGFLHKGVLLYSYGSQVTVWNDDHGTDPYLMVQFPSSLGTFNGRSLTPRCNCRDIRKN